MDGRDRAGRTPLHYAVLNSPVGLENIKALKDPALKAENHRKTVEFIMANTRRLLAEGAEVDARDDVGATPLHFASGSDCEEVVQLLIDSGADVNAAIRGDGDDRPLFISVRKITPAALAIGRLLLAAGADPSAPTTNGDSALGFVSRYGTPEQKELFAGFLEDD